MAPDTIPCRWPSPLKITAAIKELAFPLTDAGIVLAIGLFWLLGSFAKSGGILGLWLGFLLLPPFFRYALYLLEARAHGRQVPALGAELFTWAENFWSLFPLLIIAVTVWLDIYLAFNVSLRAAAVATLALVLILPASVGILGLTRSPLQSISPVAIVKLVRAVGLAYLWVPGLVIVCIVALALAVTYGLPELLANLAGVYIWFVMFTMTGALLNSSNLGVQIDIPLPREPNEDDLQRDVVRARQKVANHAYGFFSRGNRAGGLQHINAWLREEDPSDDAWSWFFAEMLKWESKDHALFFAQIYLDNLLEQHRESEIQKVLSRCLMENGRFKPAEASRAAITKLLQSHGRDDILRQLQN